MHELVYEILTESFYPVICLKGAKVKVSNFYAETEDIWRTVESRGAQRSKVSDFNSLPYNPDF